MPSAKENIYFLGPHPACLTKIKPDQKPDGQKPQTIFHHSTNMAGDTCLSQADFDDSFWKNPPAGYKVLSYQEALAQRQAWDKEWAK